MRQKSKVRQRAVSLLTAAMMICGLFAALPADFVSAQTKDSKGSAGKKASDTIKTDKENYLTDEQYEDLGLTLQDPAAFSSSDTTDPLEDYQPMILSQLYMGTMGTTESKLLDNADSLSAGALTVDSMEKKTMATADSKTIDQTCKGGHALRRNAISLRVGDLSQKDTHTSGKDIIIESTYWLWEDGLFCEDDSHHSLAVYTKDGSSISMCEDSLIDTKLSDKHWLADVGEYGLEGLTSMAVGDYDGDDYNEVAVHVATDDGGRIRIYQPQKQGSGYTLRQETSIRMDDLGARFGKSRGGKRPVVDLNTTSVAGRDDLVVSASLPFSNDDEWCNSSAVSIYSWKDGWPVNMWNSDLVYDNNAYRFKFNSSTDADLNGDGRDELVISGYKNTGYKNGDTRGTFSSKENLLNVILWDQAKSQYFMAWEKPQTLAGLDLQTGWEMQKTQLLTAACFDADSSVDTVFCEGAFYHFATGSGQTSNDTIVNGRFTHDSKEDFNLKALPQKQQIYVSGSTHVYDARFMTFGKNASVLSYASDHRDTEQIAVPVQISLNETITDGKDGMQFIYGGFTGAWVYQEGGSTKQVNMTDDISLCRANNKGDYYLFFTPVNANNNAVYLQLESKSVGWSNPAVYSILTSMPYWNELNYGSTMTARGSTAFAVNVGTTQAYSTNDNGSVTLGVGVSGGVKVFGNGGGIGVKGDATCSWTHSYQEANTRSETLTFTAGAGGDYAALLTTPIVMHNYKAYIPEHKATQSDVDNKLASKVGDTVKASTDTLTVTTQLNPVKSIVPLSQYNKVAKDLNDEHIKPIKEEDVYKDRAAGDPTTYAKDISQIASLDEKDGGTFVSQNQASVGANGQSTIAVSLSESTAKTQSKGFSVAAKCGPSVDISTGFNFLGIVDASMSMNASLMVGGGWGETWTATNTAGTTYTGTYASLPAGTPGSYSFSSNLVKWEPKLSGVNGGDVKMADGTTLTNRVSVIGATANVSSAPPALPKDFRVSGTTKTCAALAWSNVDPAAGDTGRPKVSSYQVYYSLDSAGPFQPVQKDGKNLTVDGSKTSCIVENLSPGKNYYFKLKSCTQEGGKGEESVQSPYAQGKTKGSAFEPTITQPPRNCSAKAGSIPQFTVGAKAQYDEDTLGYQWQVLDVSGSYSNEWKDISGADAASYSPTGGKAMTESQAGELDGTIYRCRVTEYRKGSNDYSMVYSKSAVLDVTGKTPLELELTPRWFDDSCVVQEGNHLTARSGEPISFDLTISGIPILNGGKYEDNEDVEIDVFKDGKKIDTCTVNTSQINAGDGAAYLATWKEEGTYQLFAFHKESSKYTRSVSQVFETEIIVDHTIHYELNGGTNSSENPTVFSTGSGIITLQPAVKDGAEFTGWYRDRELKNKVETINTAEETKDITLYAGWNNTTYKISYELNGGKNNKANPKTYDVDTEVVLKEPSRDGYLFGGWYEDAAQTKPVSGIEKGSTGDKTFYAKWGDAVSYTISYELDGGDNNPDNPQVYTAQDTVVLKDPSKANYTFSGWYTDPGFTNRVKEIAEGTTGNKTFFAKWTESISLTKKSGIYQISSYTDLTKLAKLVQMNPKKYASASYRLTGNIDCKGKSWNLPIGSHENPFTGIFDGRDYFILNLTAGGSSDTRGLFGVIGSKGKVANLSVVGIDIKSGAEKAGGIAAINHGIITKCSSGYATNTGTTATIGSKKTAVSSVRSKVRGSLAGGIAAYNDGKIYNVRSSAIVSAKGAGGIIGQNKGTVQNISSMGIVKGSDTAGGFAAANSGTMKYGYSCGSVTGKTAGALFGTNTAVKSAKAWYAKSLRQACPDQSDKKLGASAVTMASMRSQTFCNTLNKAIKSSSLVKWTRDAAHNLGYPRVQRTVVKKTTLTHKGTGLRVSGKMHPDVKLQIVKVKKGTKDYNKLKNAAAKKALQKAYRIKLVHRDGTLATYEGSLTITLPKSAKAKKFLHLDVNGKKVQAKVLPKGKKRSITVQSPGLIGQVK